MTDKKKALAEIITGYSLDLQKDEKVLIMTQMIEDKEFLFLLIDEIVKREAVPYIKISDTIISNYLNKDATDERIELLKKQSEFEVKNFDAFISIHYSINDYEGSHTPSKIKNKISKALLKTQDIRVNERKWVLLNYPSILDAYKSKMTVEEFKKYAFNVMTVDYKKMYKMCEPLKELMDKTDKVRIISPNTDLTFSIKGMKSIPCCGKYNIPDGEVYSAPVLKSVNGKITYNTPCPYNGYVFTGVSLEFKDGKIINATCNEDDKKLNEIFDTDEGARYIGEFSLGFNPMILKPMGDILYDEKILGSLHFTPGRAYKDCYNGNNSGIHWDMVLIQREDFGGGEIYFDDKLIRKNGKFIIDELKPLNFED